MVRALLIAILLSSGSAGPDPVPAPLVPPAAPEIVSGELETKNFRILHTARAAGIARELARPAEDVHEQFRQMLGRDWAGNIQIRVGLGREEFEALALPGAPPPGWAEALAYPALGIVLLDGATLLEPEGEQILRHEIAHAALGRISLGWPRWFQEGLAMHVSGERSALSQYTALFRAVRQDRIFPFSALARNWPDRRSDVEIAYAQSESFFAFLYDRHGAEGLGRLLDQMAAGASFDDAFARALGSAIVTEERAWREQLPSRYGWLPITVSSSLLWILAASLCVVAVLRRRVVKRRRLAAMAAQEAAEDAADRILEAEAAREEPPQPEGLELVEPEDSESEDREPRPPKPTLH